MTFNLDLTIAGILSISSIISSVGIAIVNNKHQAKIHEDNLSHDQQIRKLELLQQAESIQLNTYYSDKKKVFADFIKAANGYISNSSYFSSLAAVTASANNALLYCNDESRKGLLDFIDYVGSNFTTSGISESNLSEYNAKLISVCLILQKDLEETKPSFLFEPTK